MRKNVTEEPARSVHLAAWPSHPESFAQALSMTRRESHSVCLLTLTAAMLFLGVW